MKSQIHEHKKNNLKIVSKTSIIILGLAALSFTTVNAAGFKSQDLSQQELAALTVENTQEQSQLVLVNNEISNHTGETANADTFFSPNSVVSAAYVKTTEDVIAEDKSITEAKEEIFQPLSLDYTKADRIAEDNQIIESDFSNETFPLDFEKINRNVKCNAINNTAIKVELKL